MGARMPPKMRKGWIRKTVVVGAGAGQENANAKEKEKEKLAVSMDVDTDGASRRLSKTGIYWLTKSFKVAPRRQFTPRRRSMIWLRPRILRLRFQFLHPIRFHRSINI